MDVGVKAVKRPSGGPCASAFENL